MNPTTRKFPHSMEEAFSSNTLAIQRRKQATWFEGHQPTGRLRKELETWGMVGLAFFAGYLVRMIWS